jgi:hypothetical protein
VDLVYPGEAMVDIRGSLDALGDQIRSIDKS